MERLFSLVGFLGACAVVLGIHGAEWRQHTTVANVEFVVPLWFFALLSGGIWGWATKKPLIKATLTRLFRVTYSEYPSVWNEIWESPKEALFVRVHLSDGTVHLGAVHAYTRDPSEQQRETWLRPVYELDQEGQPGGRLPGLSLFVPSASIVYAEVYRPEDALHSSP